MNGTADTLDGPDLASGVPLTSIADDGMLLGHAHGEPVLVARRGDELFAIGAVCTHYGAPLGDGLLVDDTVRWDKAEMDGQLEGDKRDCTITYRRVGKKLAVAVVHRDLEGLLAEVEFERMARGEPS
ncbi:MAG TPA: Rieske 2Fe-2S domain-containing protein [Gemmatimonadaceae bacterium]